MDKEKILNLAQDIQEDLTELRRHFHAHPELSWKETETSRLIKVELEKMALFNIRHGFKGTGSGVMADLIGHKAGSCVALRADIDGLPILEENDFSYISQNPGVMHACGHDAHTAILLGAARLLSKMREEIHGTVRFIFQPAEEAGTDSGAPAMIAEGVLDGVQAIAGLHVMSHLTAGCFAIRKGPIMASADVWELTIQGQGGHTAFPHLSVDPTVAASHIIGMLQTIVSRELDPLENTVVSIGKLEAGSAFNVIPDKVIMSGTVRSTRRETRDGMEARFRRIIDGACAALRCSTKLTYTPVYPVTINDDYLTNMLRECAEELLGPEKCLELSPVMASEDFAYYGETIPAVFGMFGIGDPSKGTDRPHHSPHFNANDDILSDGAALMAGFALTYLERLQQCDSRKYGSK